MIGERKRYVYLDVIKIISAFMVVFYHFGKVDLGDFAGDNYIFSCGQLLYCICSASVPLFFMVNGALLLNKSYSVEKIYYKAAKIALLTIVWSFTGFPSWFFKTLIVLYLLYPIIVRIYRLHNQIWIYGIMGCVFLFPFVYNFLVIIVAQFCPDMSFSLFGHIFSLETIPFRTGAKTMYSLLYFLLGGHLFNKKVNSVFSGICVFLGVVFVAFDVIIASNYHNEIADAVNGCFPTIGALLLSFGLFNFLKIFDRIKNEKIVKIISTLGSSVLCVYLFHMIIMIFVKKVLFLNGYYSIALVLLISAAIFLFCCLINLLFKRIPLVKELIKI